jgi:hypothetical protein
MGGVHEDIAEMQDGYDRGYTNFSDKQCRSIIKIVSSRRAISKFHILYPQILGAAVQYIVARVSRLVGFVQPCMYLEICSLVITLLVSVNK